MVKLMAMWLVEHGEEELEALYGSNFLADDDLEDERLRARQFAHRAML